MWERLPCTASLRHHGLLLALGNCVISVFENLFALWKEQLGLSRSGYYRRHKAALYQVLLCEARLHHLVTTQLGGGWGCFPISAYDSC